MGTAGHGSRKKHRSSGNRGGKGMAGTGKRADHKKTLVTKLYGHGYFGKQGITSRGTKKDKSNKINLGTIKSNFDNLIKKGIAKPIKDGYEIDLKDFIILGEGDVKNLGKLIIKAKKASESALEKMKNIGGEIIIEQKTTKIKKEITKSE